MRKWPAPPRTLWPKSPAYTTSNLQDIEYIGGTILAPYSYSSSIAGLRITSVMQNANNATVQWSYATGTLTAASQGDTYSLPAGLASQGQAVVIAEASYNFTPVIGAVPHERGYVFGEGL